MESPWKRVWRAFSERDPDWAEVAIVYAAIALGTGLIVYGVVAQ